MTDIKHYHKLAQATHKADNAARTVRLLQSMGNSSNWKIYSASERKQIFRALDAQRDTLRRFNKAVDRIVSFRKNNPLGETRGNRG